MRHRKQKFTLDRPAVARRRLARQLMLTLVAHGRLRTSGARARYLRAVVEPLVTAAKRGDLAARRRVLAALQDRAAATTLLKRAEGYRDRPGGYVRLTRLPHRRSGDATALVQVEWV